MSHTRLTRQQVRDIDRRAIEEFGVPGLILMENAGRSAAEILMSLLPPLPASQGKGTEGDPSSPLPASGSWAGITSSPLPASGSWAGITSSPLPASGNWAGITSSPLPASGRGAGGEGSISPIILCCGKGNNAGDGFVIARHLDNHGIPVRVLLFAQPTDLTGDAATNFHIIERSGLPIRIQPPLADLPAEFAAATWLVDALFGTGLAGPVRPPFDQIIEAMNASAKPIFAVDIPSGLYCDTGLPLGPTIRAVHTVTFVAEKIGFANPTAKKYLGVIHVGDIGAPRFQRT